jgi:hypothetical protein
MRLPPQKPRCDLDDARSSVSVGPTLLRSHESPTPTKLTNFTGLGLVSSTCLGSGSRPVISGSGSNRFAAALSAIGHQNRGRDWAYGEKTAEHQADEMGEMRQSRPVEKDQEVEVEEGELVCDRRERWGDDTWVSDSRRDSDWADREPGGSWPRHASWHVALRRQVVKEGWEEGQRQGMGPGQGRGRD